MPRSIDKGSLERLYRIYTKREYVHPDPIEFLYDYRSVGDREIAGLVASALAYGRVTQILKNVECVLSKAAGPKEFILNSSRGALAKIFSDFCHRFARTDELVWLLHGMRRVIEEHGSLNACFRSFMGRKDETIVPALTGFVSELNKHSKGRAGHLIPIPERGSACKRLNLFLRWMVRRDEVDPGGWRGIKPSQLIVPLDTHLHRISRELGFTSRRQANMRTAVEITESFKEYAPDDPVRYDFALTRFGIHPEVRKRRLRATA